MNSIDTKSPTTDRFETEIFYRILKYLDRLLLATLFALQVKNAHYIPATGPAILAANHASFMDSPVLQAASGRRIIYFMTERFYDPLWGRWFFKRMHCIPVHENTVYNLASLRIALSLLKEGKVIGIFPEGGISRDGRLQQARPGALLLAQKSSAPIVPAFISGTYQALPRHAKFFRKAKITVSFGNPLFFNELSNSLSGKPGLEKATDNLFKKFRELGPNHP